MTASAANGTGFRSATAAHPCAVCGGKDGCSEKSDGLILCRRRQGPQPGFRCLGPARGDPAWTCYRRKGDPGPDRPANGHPAPVRAEPDVLHEVYGALLGQLNIAQKHAAALRARGFKADIMGCGYRSMPTGRLHKHIVDGLRKQYGDKLLSKVPGFAWVDPPHGRGRRSFAFCCCPGLLIPVRDVQGRIVALKVRRDDATNNKYVYVSSTKYGGPGPGAPPHVPFGVGPKQAMVRLTEGELKADGAAALDGVPTIASPGMNWQACLPVLKELDVKTVLLAYDADAVTNPSVGKKVAECFDGLQDAGYEVQFERWPAEHGKGIDDVLAAGHQTEVLTGEEAAAAVRALAGVSATGGHELNGTALGQPVDNQPDRPNDLEFVGDLPAQQQTVAGGNGRSRRHTHGNFQDYRDSGDWPKPIPLDHVPEPAPFPVAVLPQPLAALVSEIGWALNCPVDFPAVHMLGLAGGAVGNSRTLAITSSHHQSACLFTSSVGEPGSAKSPPLAILREPLDEAQAKMLDAFRADLKAWKEQQENGTQEECKVPKPVPNRCVAGDTTTESLKHTLAENPRGLVMPQDELSGLIMAMNQYKMGRGNDRAFYLSLWSGATYINDRRSQRDLDGAPLFILRPFCGIVGNIQPAVLDCIRGERRGGRPAPDDGFIDRFLLSFPDEVQAAGEAWREVSAQARHDWRDVVDKLLGLEMVPGNNGHPRPFLLRLSACGQRQWEEFTRGHAAELNDPAFHRHLKGPWSKLKGYCGRLALIIHLLRWAAAELDADADRSEVDGESVARAGRLVAYFKAHARRAHAAMDADERIADAKKVWEWVQRERRTEFKLRDVFEDLKSQGRFPTLDDLNAPIGVLEQHNLIRLRPEKQKPGPGRKPAPVYEVNPLANHPMNPGNPTTRSQEAGT